MTNGADQKKRDESRKDAELDEALEDTFPASDPPAATNPSSFTGAEVAADRAAAEDRSVSDELDRELEQTFPASDTPSVVRKHGREDA